MSPDGFWYVSIAWAVLGLILADRLIRRLKRERRVERQPILVMLINHEIETQRYRMLKQAILGLLPWMLLVSWWGGWSSEIRVVLFWLGYLAVQGLFWWTSFRIEHNHDEVLRRLSSRRR